MRDHSHKDDISIKAPNDIYIKNKKVAGILIEFYKRLIESIEFSVQKELSEQDRKDLLTALNKNPLLKEKYTQVLADGSLKTTNQTVKWSSL